MKIEAQLHTDSAAPGDEVGVLLHLEGLRAPDQPARVVRAPRLTVHLKPAVRLLRLGDDPNDPPVPNDPAGPADPASRRRVAVALDDLAAGERRTLPLAFQVPEAAAAGLLRLATLEVRYVEVPALTRHLLTVPLAVEIVPR